MTESSYLLLAALGARLLPFLQGPADSHVSAGSEVHRVSSLTTTWPSQTFNFCETGVVVVMAHEMEDGATFPVPGFR